MNNDPLTPDNIQALGFQDGNALGCFSKIVSLSQDVQRRFMLMLKPVKDQDGLYNVVYNPAITDSSKMVTLTQVSTLQELNETIRVVTYFERDSLA